MVAPAGTTRRSEWFGDMGRLQQERKETISWGVGGVVSISTSFPRRHPDPPLRPAPIARRQRQAQQLLLLRDPRERGVLQRLRLALDLHRQELLHSD